VPLPPEQPSAPDEGPRPTVGPVPNAPRPRSGTPFDGKAPSLGVPPSTDPRAGSGIGVDGKKPAGRKARKRDDEERTRGRRTLRTVIEWLAVIGGALVVALLVKTFLVQAFWIPSPSMSPALNEGDRVLVNKLADGVDDINRGDIIVFERPNADGNGGPESGIKDLIKRAVALPGETVEAREGVVFIDGQRLEEPYLEPGTITSDFPPFAVPDGHVYVMGDNRANSQDSRSFEAIPGGDIVGRAFFRVYPLGDIGRL
jgi:signal peptidase I